MNALNYPVRVGGAQNQLHLNSEIYTACDKNDETLGSYVWSNGAACFPPKLDLSVLVLKAVRRLTDMYWSLIPQQCEAATAGRN